MKLGVFTVLLGAKPLDDACRFLADSGVQAVEIGCGGFPGKAHCDPLVLLDDAKALDTFKKTIENHGLVISALSTHGNAVHPDTAIATKAHNDFVGACKLAEKLGQHTVVTFSGCPGGAAGDTTPNWVTCSWPTDFSRTLEYQWNDVLIPYWQKTAKIAADYGVNQIAFEMHPGFCVYAPPSLLKLRAAVGDSMGANFDPSHLYWQGIDPSAAIRALQGAIFHFHAKDTAINERNKAVRGVLDVEHYSNAIERSWVFRSVGYGHDLLHWREMMSTLRMVGYDGAISIEHEDGLMSINEGLQKSILFLKDAMMFENPADMWWA